MQSPVKLRRIVSPRMLIHLSSQRFSHRPCFIRTETVYDEHFLTDAFQRLDTTSYMLFLILGQNNCCYTITHKQIFNLFLEQDNPNLIGIYISYTLPYQFCLPLPCKDYQRLSYSQAHHAILQTLHQQQQSHLYSHL